MSNRFILLLGLLLLLWSCTPQNQPSDPVPQEWVSAKVAVVLPLSGEDNDKTRYDRITQMFEQQLKKAQYGMPKGVRLELEWYDENAVDIDDLAYDFYLRNDLHAIIGPLHNEHVEAMADMVYNKGIPMFVMSSSEEVVRRYSSGTAGVTIKKPFMWSLTETDIVQARILLLKIGTLGQRKVSVISVENRYGDTFNKWVPYQANELEMTIVDRLQYKNDNELKHAVDQVCASQAEAVICAVNNVADAKVVMQQIKSKDNAPKVYFTGSVLGSQLLELGPLAEGMEGFSIYPSPNTGFHLAYQVRYKENPMPVEAQLYDAYLLSLLSFAYSHYSDKKVSMNDALVALSDLPLSLGDDEFEEFYWESGTPVWDYAGMRSAALQYLCKGQLPPTNLIGASGNLKFASDSYTTLINNCYINWLVYNGQVVSLDFVNENGFRLTQYTPSWVWQSGFDNLEDNSNTGYKYRQAKSNKAVLICGSEGWYNYRHQADILNVYQHLKKNGFSDDDIILIMRDDIANHPKNKYPGVIKVSPNGPNLYQDVVLDYRADTLAVTDLMSILQGEKSDKLHTVLESTNTDNVLLFWTGHGKKGSFSWLETKESFSAEQLAQTLRQMYDKQMYQSMLVCTEPCYSGSVLQAIEGIPLVLGFSAADAHESSFADNYSTELGIWMCDRFSNNLMQLLDKKKTYTLAEVYSLLNSSTMGSHVCAFNLNMFYFLQIATVKDYFWQAAEFNDIGK